MSASRSQLDQARWTHLALRVGDIEAMIAFYESYTPLRLIERRSDPDGFAAWLGHPGQSDHPFILVLSQFLAGRDPWEGTPLAVLNPFNHLGIEYPTAAAIDEIADRAAAEGILALEPTLMPDPIGYICMVTDPEGNLVECSYGQRVYETVRRRWQTTENGAPDDD